ncbi:hypothetical protein [Aquimarina sp. Aq107]|uniref:hypothetical protein n=1 Tax=Aquimarina sp. Aq107 TaxID=1191912 RepID=UPI00131F0E05|nr:hypothetical protein [Aquimarina sp. Aq107]
MIKKLIIFLNVSVFSILFFSCEINLENGTSSEGKSIEQNSFDILKTSNDPEVNWSGEVTSYLDDIWIIMKKNDVATYDLRIGTGGVISEIRDRTESFKQLLSPTFNGEQTDRVVQWTLWSFNGDIKNTASNLPSFEHRYNVTQGGTFDNQLSETISVNVNKDKNQIDIYSVPKLQWKSQNQIAMTGIHSSLTRYSVHENGYIKIHRIVSIGNPKLFGDSQRWTDLYLEGWTPMNGSEDVFDGLALSIDDSGRPNWWYRLEQNIPNYPWFRASETQGYAIAFNTKNPRTNDALALVYGKNDIRSHANADYFLNTMSWNNGIGILPTIKSNSTIPNNSIIEQTLYLVPREGLSNTLKYELDEMVDKIPPPKIHFPDAVPDELINIYERLKLNELLSGLKTDNLNSITHWE